MVLFCMSLLIVLVTVGIHSFELVYEGKAIVLEAKDATERAEWTKAVERGMTYAKHMAAVAKGP
jgi:hypothetical protein